MRLVHLSDLHFGALEAGRPEALERAVKSLHPDVLVVSGDLTQKGTRKEFHAAKAFLARLPVGAFVVPGNHDMPHGMHLWSRFHDPWQKYREVIGTELEPAWDRQDLRLIGVNSGRPGGWYLDWSRGRLSQQQLARVESLCAGLPPEILRVLVVHHPPAAPPQGTARHLIDRREPLLNALNRAGIDLVLCGHFHQSYAIRLPLPGQTPRACVLSVTSTATSFRLQGEPNGFHVIEGDGAKLLVEAWAWCGERYAPARQWRFTRGENRHWSEP